MEQKKLTKQNPIHIREATVEEIDQCADVCFNVTIGLPPEHPKPEFTCSWPILKYD